MKIKNLVTLKYNLNRIIDIILMPGIPLVIVGLHVSGWIELLKQLGWYFMIIVVFLFLRIVYKQSLAFILRQIRSKK